MPVRIYYNNDPGQACTIRPTPLVSISTNILKNPAGEAFGVTYTIVLTGTILADQGMPFGFKTDDSLYTFIDGISRPRVGPYGAFNSSISHFVGSANNGKPPGQRVSEIEASNSIFSKQKALRALFAKDGQVLEITDFNDDQSTIICYPRIVDINFTEGVYIDRCDYTINLECDTLLNHNLQVDNEGTFIAQDPILYQPIAESNLINNFNGCFISEYSEDWSIEVDDSVGESVGVPYNPLDPDTQLDDAPRTYRITHNLSATGKTHYGPSGKVAAWQSAKKFVQYRIRDDASRYPNINFLASIIGEGSVNLINTLYGGYNLIRTEQVSESNGTYGVSETWLLATGIAYENYNLSVSKSSDGPFITVNIDGNIKGLTNISPGGYRGGLTADIELSTKNTAYANALIKYGELSHNGTFSIACPIYKRANNVVVLNIEKPSGNFAENWATGQFWPDIILNPTPKSLSLAQNEYTGEITYNIQYDNRPINVITGALAESINVNDTYPGDLFSVIQVIGRETGPVLQYIGGRTEYKRDLSINLTMDYTKVAQGSGRTPFMLTKPSIVEPTASQLANLITQISPAYEPGVRKYFISPPTESWNPKEGTYSLNISWTYELDK